VERVKALIRQLDPLLAEKKFDALGCYRQLRQLLNGTALEPEIIVIGRQLDEFRFGAVQDSLQTLIAAQNWADAAQATSTESESTP